MLEMNAINLSTFGGSGQLEYETIIQGTSETTEWVKVPDNIGRLLYTVVVLSGTGKLQTTLDTIENIKNNTVNIDLIDDWDAGDAAVGKYFVVSQPIKAFRLVATGGTTKIAVKACSK